MNIHLVDSRRRRLSWRHLGVGSVPLLGHGRCWEARAVDSRRRRLSWCHLGVRSVPLLGHGRCWEARAVGEGLVCGLLEHRLVDPRDVGIRARGRRWEWEVARMRLRRWVALRVLYLCWRKRLIPRRRSKTANGLPQKTKRGWSHAINGDGHVCHGRHQAARRLWRRQWLIKMLGWIGAMCRA